MIRCGAFVLALSLAACGDAGGGLDQFPSDGVAAFGPSAPVDVCIGAARVAPGGAASLCMSAATKPLACAADTDCDAPERCQCGQCVVRPCGPGITCPAGETCRGGRCTAACTADAECAAGEICNGGGCTHACDADAQCRRGEVCDFFGACAASACGPSVSCGSGQTCEPLAIDGDAREPAVVSVDGADIFFFELRGASGSAIYRAGAPDPLHFKADPETPVLTAPAGAASVGAPSAIARDGHVDLFVAVDGGASIGLATSTDRGRTFAWTSPDLLVPGESWENGSVGSPGAFERDGATYVFYEGGPGAGIGLAKLDGAALSRVATTPLMRPSDLEDAAFWRSVKTLGAPFALVDGDAVRVYVTAGGIEAGTAITANGPVPGQPNDSIGLFATLDLKTFDRYPTGPVYATIAGLFGSLGEREPAVRTTLSGADLYFVATDASGAKSSGLSRASTIR